MSELHNKLDSLENRLVASRTSPAVQTSLLKGVCMCVCAHACMCVYFSVCVCVGMCVCGCM